MSTRDKNVDIPPRLFEQLSQLPGYTFDVTRPVYHSSYDNWHVYGTRHIPLADVPSSSSAQGISQNGRPSSVTNLTYMAGVKSPGLSQNQHRNVFSPVENPSSPVDEEDPSECSIPVVARISSHTLRIEREFQLASRLQKLGDPDCLRIVRPIDLIHLSASGLVASVFASPGVNSLQEFFGQLASKKYFFLNGEIDQRQSAATLPGEEQLMPLHLFLTFAIGACECLELLHHSSNTVHGELREDAFHFSRKDGAVRLLNFGSGPRAFENGLNSHVWSELSKQSGIEDRLMYIAPEQTGRMAHNPDTRTDIYSLGVLFYILLSRKRPFESTDPMEIVQCVLSKKLPPIHTVRMDVPEILTDIIHKMTSKRVEKRYSSATGLKHDMKFVQSCLGTGKMAELKNYKLGTKDIVSFFRLPSVMLGREEYFTKIVKIIASMSRRHARAAASRHGVFDINPEAQSSNSTSAGIFGEPVDSGSMSSGEVSKMGPLSKDDSSTNDSYSELLSSTGGSSRKESDGFGPGSMAIPHLSKDPSSSTFNMSERSKSTTTSGNSSQLVEQVAYKRRGRCEVIAISGPAGVGKSSLVASVQTEARRRGCFASAKFDRARQRPFDAILKVISSIFKQMLTESEEIIGELSYNVRAFLKPQWVSLHRALDLPDLSNVFHHDADMPFSGHVTYSSRGSTDTETNDDFPSPTPDSSASPADIMRIGGNKMRFRSMLVELLRMLSKAKLLCLCLDDLQFADQESLDLLSAIVTSRNTLVLIVTYREDEMDIAKVRSVLSSDRSNLTHIALKELGEDDVREYLAQTLHQTKDAVRPLAAILMEKTQGNPFYMREMLHTCFLQGGITYDWKSSAWTYDFDFIFKLFESGEYQSDASRNDLIIKRFQDISNKDVRMLLAWASLLGSTFSFRFVKRLFYGKHLKQIIPEDLDLPTRTQESVKNPVDDVVNALQYILEIGLIVPTENEDVFRFAHDRYLHAASGLQAMGNRSHMHLAISLLMIEEQRQGRSTDWQTESFGSYNIAYHLCESSDILKAKFQKRYPYRKILINAARKAAENGAHFAAIDFNMTAINLLQENPWGADENPDSFYEETLDLYNRTAESLWYQNGQRLTEIVNLAKVVMQNARNPTDKVTCWILYNRVLLQTRKFKEALSSTLELLRMLDIDVSGDWTWEDCDSEYAILKTRILELQQDKIASISINEDPTCLALGSVLFEATIVAYILSMELFYRLVLRMVRMHLDQGAYTETGIAYVYLGSLALQRYNDPIFASELAEVGTRCLDTYGDIQTNGRGTVLYMVFLSHLKVHVSVAAAGLNTALEYNIAAGDRMFASFTLANTAAYKFYASEDLREVDAYCKYAMDELSAWSEEPDPGIILISVQQTVKALMGKTNIEDPKEVLSDEAHDSTKFIALVKSLLDDPDFALNTYNTFRIMVLYLFGHYNEAVEIGDACIKKIDLTPAQRDTRLLLFYYSLSLISKIRENPDLADRDFSETLQKIRYYKGCIEAWTGTSDVNYRAWIDILRAEIHDVEGNYFEAARVYEIALDACQQGGFALEEALTYEVAGEFYIRRGIKRASQNFLKEAATTYTQVGASAKADQLRARHGKSLRNSNTRSRDVGCQTDFHVLHQDNNVDQFRMEQEPTSQGLGEAWIPPQRDDSVMLEDPKVVANTLLSPITLDTLDLNAIITSSRLISSEVELDTLLAKMCQIVLDNMGSQADSVSIIVKEEEQFLVSAVGDIDNGVKTHQPGLPLTSSDVNVSAAIILYIVRTHETLFIHNVAEDERFSNTSEEWNNNHPQGKSVIAMPIVNNRSELVGVVYLEGAVNAFTDRNLVVLSYLTSQIGISITNALLFASVKAVSRTNYAMIESLNNALAKAQESKERAKAAREEAIRMMKLKEEASRAKSEFLANISHEIRTPLSGVVGICELLRSTELTTEQSEMTESMRKCADTLLTVINDILDYSKIEAGKMKFFNVPFCLWDNIHEVVRALSYANLERNVKVVEKLDIPKQLVLGDPARIHQVLMNLLSNAFKFCNEGFIRVNARKDDEDEESITYTVSVADTGIGIDKETLALLFMPFSQADSSTGKRFGGTGLGLSICKSLIESMGGTISMTSEFGKGTTVFFNIKFQKAPTNAAPHDNTLRPLDPDPMEQYNRTANQAPDDENENSFWAKAQSKFLASLPRKDLKILLVEDNSINQKIALSFIRKLKFNVDAVDNGQQAVDTLRKHAKEGKPYHLVLMDIMMPVMDGYTACKTLRSDDVPEVKNVLVIAMTASAIRGDRERCLDAGMNDYLAKPVRAAVLKNMLEKYLERPENPNATEAEKFAEDSKVRLAAKDSIMAAENSSKSSQTASDDEQVLPMSPEPDSDHKILNDPMSPTLEDKASASDKAKPIESPTRQPK